MTRWNTRASARDRGAAAVEFALVAVLLLTILFGIFEGGRLWMIQSSLSQAAREGAREMAINNTIDTANTKISSWSSSIGVTVDPDISVEAGESATECKPGGTVHAKAKANVESMTGFIDPLFPGPNNTIPLTGKADMRCGG